MTMAAKIILTPAARLENAQGMALAAEFRQKSRGAPCRP